MSLVPITHLGTARRRANAQRSLSEAVERVLGLRKRPDAVREHLKADGWQVEGPENTRRLMRRIAINHLGRGTPLLSRTGYRNVFQYHSHLFRAPGTLVTSYADRPHVGVRLAHPDWPDAIVVALDKDAHLRTGGDEAVALWAFVTDDFDAIDLDVIRPLFNGTGPGFRSHSGRWHGLDHEVRCRSEGFYGAVQTRGRDTKATEFISETFWGKLLPALELATPCRLIYCAHGARYY